MPLAAIDSDLLLVTLEPDEGERWRARDWNFRAAYLACIREHGLKMGIDQFIIRDAVGHLDSGATGARRGRDTAAALKALLVSDPSASMSETTQVIITS